MASQRTDGRGHWPAGRRRNDKPPRGWRTMEAFLGDVAQFCGAEYGRASDLARSLGVHHSTVQAWLAQRKWPARATAARIARWYRGRRRRQG